MTNGQVDVLYQSDRNESDKWHVRRRGTVAVAVRIAENYVRATASRRVAPAGLSRVFSRLRRCVVIRIGSEVEGGPGFRGPFRLKRTRARTTLPAMAQCGAKVWWCGVVRCGAVWCGVVRRLRRNVGGGRVVARCGARGGACGATLVVVVRWSRTRVPRTTHHTACGATLVVGWCAKSGPSALIAALS